MLKRVVHLSVTSLLFLPLFGCSTGGEDEGGTFGSFTTQTTFNTSADMGEESDSSGNGDGDGDTGPGDGDGDPAGDGDGDGDPGDGDGDDTSCPPGEFGCPCDNGQCAPGLECNMGECSLGGGDGDGDPTTTSTTGGGGDPWDPDPLTCVDPDIPVTITGIEGSSCSATCASDLDCPAGPAGTTPACVLILDGAMDPDHCALICDPVNDTCSPGASCKQVPNQPGVGLCTYP